jgi:hypothetical protein
MDRHEADPDPVEPIAHRQQQGEDRCTALPRNLLDFGRSNCNSPKAQGISGAIHPSTAIALQLPNHLRCKLLTLGGPAATGLERQSGISTLQRTPHLYLALTAKYRREDYPQRGHPNRWMEGLDERILLNESRRVRLHLQQPVSNGVTPQTETLRACV